MAEPVTQNFIIYLPETFKYSFIWEESNIVEGKTVISPKNLTGWKGELIIVPEESINAWLTIRNENLNGAYLDFGGETGKIEIYISDKKTKDIEWTSAKYGLFMFDESDKCYPIMAGKMSAKQIVPVKLVEIEEETLYPGEKEYPEENKYPI